MNFYIAAPFDTEEKRANAIKVKEILSKDKNNSVFVLGNIRFHRLGNILTVSGDLWCL